MNCPREASLMLLSFTTPRAFEKAAWLSARLPTSGSAVNTIFRPHVLGVTKTQ